MIKGVILLLLLGLLVSYPAVSAAQFTLYDDFNSPSGKIDATRWRGDEQNTDFGVIRNLEAGRVIEIDPATGNGFLLLGLKNKHLGTLGLDTGFAGESRNGLRVGDVLLLDHEPAITGLKTKVIVDFANAGACPTNTLMTRADAQMFGFFFNDGTSTGPTDFTGDVIAGLLARRDSTGANSIVAFLNRCDTANCLFSVNLKFFVFTTTWALGTPVPLKVVWDRLNHQFNYIVGPVGSQEVTALTYGDIPLSDTNPARLFLYALRVANRLPNCSTPLGASIIARFDMLNIRLEAGVFP